MFGRWDLLVGSCGHGMSARNCEGVRQASLVRPGYLGTVQSTLAYSGTMTVRPQKRR